MLLPTATDLEASAICNVEEICGNAESFPFLSSEISAEKNVRKYTTAKNVFGDKKWKTSNGNTCIMMMKQGCTYLVAETYSATGMSNKFTDYQRRFAF